MIIERMKTQLRQRKEVLSETPFFDGKTIKDCFLDSTIDRLLECYVQAIKYNEYSLDVIKKAICTIFFHIVSTDNQLLQNFSLSNWCKYKIVGAESYILKLDVYDVIIFIDGNTGRLKELRGKTAILEELNKQEINKVQLQAKILSKMIRLIWRNRNNGSVLKKSE
ncbi:odorant receptor 13a-like [Vespula maculifrons]|uniref:Odorant receptor 13a-like n=1 Tax=Vespula maculifrons TaxID=7453 RepID=A0ABD2BPE3_VESMC